MISAWAGFIFLSGLLFGFLLGAFLEWSERESAIQASFKEQEELRGVIYALTHNRPTPSGFES